MAPNAIAGLALWLDASQLTGLTDGAALASWTDFGGGSLHAVQATGGNKPLYKTAIVNGKPTVRFDGTDDYMVTPAFVGQTTVVVLKHTEATFASYRRVVDGWAGGVNTHSLLGMSGRTDYNNDTLLSTGYASSNFWINGVNTISPPALTTAHIVVGVATAASSNAAHAVGTYMASSTAAAAGAQALYADVAEIVVYSGVLSTSDRRGLEASLGAKYGITVT